MQSPQNLIWIDLEMTGLEPEHDVIIEMATIVTDSDLNILATGPVIAVISGVFDAPDPVIEARTYLSVFRNTLPENNQNA